MTFNEKAMWFYLGINEGLMIVGFATGLPLVPLQLAALGMQIYYIVRMGKASE